MSNETRPEVGGGDVCDVVIATRNRPDALVRCIDGLRRQSFGGFGVIVVDDGSDEPIDPDRVGSAGTGIRFVSLPHPSGPAAARNAGVAASTARFIVFVDDDVRPNEAFVRAHLDTVLAPHPSDRPIVSCGPFVQPSDWVPTPWNLWEARQAKKEADALTDGSLAVTWRQFHTGNNCVPRRLFQEAGGFDATFKRAEDDEFGLRIDRLGCQFRFQPEAIAWHYAHRDLAAWLSIPAAYARYDVEIDRRYPDVGYLAAKQTELAERQPLLRVARRLFSGPRRHRLAVSSATLAARLLYRVGAVNLAMAALSMAYDLCYTRSLAHWEAQRPRVDTGVAA